MVRQYARMSPIPFRIGRNRDNEGVRSRLYINGRRIPFDRDLGLQIEEIGADFADTICGLPPVISWRIQYRRHAPRRGPRRYRLVTLRVGYEHVKISGVINPKTYETTIRLDLTDPIVETIETTLYSLAPGRPYEHIPSEIHALLAREEH